MRVHLTSMVLLAALFIFFGCGTTRTSRFYTLTPMPDKAVPIGSKMATQGLGVGVGPIKIPDALDRAQLVIRKGPNELQIAEFERWAGSFKKDMGRTIAENLSMLLCSDRVFTYPWSGYIPVDYQVVIDIIRFDGKPNENVILNAQWIVIKKDRNDVRTTKKTHLTVPVSGPGYAGLVETQSQALARLCHDIAESISGLCDPTSKTP